MLNDATETILRLLGRINATLDRAGLAVAATFLAIMTILVLAQVVFRYGFNASLGWSEELSKTMMVWMAFLVAPAAYRRGLNVAIEIFVEAFPRRARLVANLLINTSVAWILAVFLGESLDFVARGMSATAATLPIKMGWFYTIVPVSFAAMLLVAAELLLRDLQSLLTGGRRGESAPCR